jgi:hypothetical protein
MEVIPVQREEDVSFQAQRGDDDGTILDGSIDERPI